jgi:hypothetical protein
MVVCILVAESSHLSCGSGGCGRCLVKVRSGVLAPERLSFLAVGSVAALLGVRERFTVIVQRQNTWITSQRLYGERWRALGGERKRGRRRRCLAVVVVVVVVFEGFMAGGPDFHGRSDTAQTFRDAFDTYNLRCPRPSPFAFTVISMKPLAGVSLSLFLVGNTERNGSGPKVQLQALEGIKKAISKKRKRDAI